jgi:ABC-type nickel/cobalt efflux system permease component RcnA
MMRYRLLAAVVAAFALVLLPGAPASAHPLGNFTVNQYLGLSIGAGRVAATAIVDTAEIPTLQDKPAVDADGSGTVSAAERAAHAGAVCGDLAGAVAARVETVTLQWTVRSAEYVYVPGSGGLDTARTTCSLSASAPGSGRLSVANGYLADRVGWREITMVGDGTRLIDPSVPATSVSRELTAYPPDLLSSALDVRAATVEYAPGSGVAGGPLAGTPPGGDPLSRWVATVDRHFTDLAGSRTLTPLVAALAVALALLLGAGHAALPGHGKTILAAYLAGKRGRPRDAWMVAGTVTATHTGGVLMLGLVISAGAAIAGERVLSWLGLVSGVVVLGVGAGMLRTVIRPRPHAHEHGHQHGFDHGHPHGHEPGQGRHKGWGLFGIGVAGGLVPSPSALVVLLAAGALGRGAFGVVLVLCYGAGMALMLAGAGLGLLAVQRRLLRRASTSRLSTVVARLHAATPAATAALVLLVGAGLALRSASGML